MMHMKLIILLVPSKNRIRQGKILYIHAIDSNSSLDSKNNNILEP